MKIKVVDPKPRANSGTRSRIQTFNEGYEKGYHECKQNYEEGFNILKNQKLELDKKIIEQKFEQTKELLSVFGQSIQAMADLLRRAKE